MITTTIDTTVTPAPDDEPEKIELATSQQRKWLEEWFLASKPQALARLEDLTRFVPYGAEEPPAGGWRIVNGRLAERWTRVEASRKVSNVYELARTLQTPPLGWSVTRYLLPTHCECPKARLVHLEGRLVHQSGCGMERASRVEGSLAEHVASLQIAPEDDATYNGYYPTIPGKDQAHINLSADPHSMAYHQGGVPLFAKDGTPITGGTEIRGGRAEHRRKTKHLVHVDNGYQGHVDRLEAEKKAKKKADQRTLVEREVRKMPRRLGEL